MFSSEEQRAIELKALEQAIRAAHLANVELTPLLPVLEDWPFPLTNDDRTFLKINKISAA